MSSRNSGSAKRCRNSKSIKDCQTAPAPATRSKAPVSTMSSEPSSLAVSSKPIDIAPGSGKGPLSISSQPSGAATSPQKHASGTCSVPPSLSNDSESSNSGGVRYVCTVHQACGTTFDSFDAWAQHECNAHPKLYDIWYCNGVDGCTDAYCKQADFEAHFKTQHTMDRINIPRSPIPNDYLLGPKHGKRFWCGFCNMVLHRKNDGFTWGYERLEHVKSHFDFECPDEMWYCDIYGWNFIQVVPAESKSSQTPMPPPARPPSKCPDPDSIGGEMSKS